MRFRGLDVTKPARSVYKGRRVEVQRVEERKNAQVENVAESQDVQQRESTRVERNKERKKVRARVSQLREATAKRAKGKRKKKEETEWSEEIVRVGTGFRVRIAPVDPQTVESTATRDFDVGFSDRKKYKRKEHVEVELAKNHIGRKLKLVAKGARQTLINEVCKIENRRKRSEYTGCGITRKSRVGKKKLKPTKVRAV